MQVLLNLVTNAIKYNRPDGGVRFLVRSQAWGATSGSSWLPGIRLIPALQGKLGIELAREHRPDLILLDLHLPDMAGEAVLQTLRDDPRTRAIPIAILSADATRGRIERLLAAGARRYLTKPLDVPQFSWGQRVKPCPRFPVRRRGRGTDPLKGDGE